MRDFAAARERERHHTPKNLLLALSGEVGELCAELQWLPTDGDRVDAARIERNEARFPPLP